MASTLQRPHALIVSDDVELSDFLGEGLVYAGFWTSVIASAMQALEVFRLRSFDVILLDATLGGIGALELVRRLRGLSDRAVQNPRTDIPIVIIAAAAGEIDAHAAERAGVDRVVLAPIELEELAQVLQREVQAWREAHPDRPWADADALAAS
jgi:CheY-like chemotaxis protein